MATSFQIHGRVQAVYYDRAGSTVAADQAPGASVIVLNDVYDFDETGGTALNTVTLETVTYTALDDTACSLTLSGVTTTTWSGEDFVVPGDGASQDKRLIASVQDVEEGDVDARIPLRWFDVLPEGTRDSGTGEAVVLDYDEANGEYILTDILGDTPTVDGTFLSPGTITTTSVGSDGVAPASSPAPTVTPGIGTLFVRWTPMVNADPVTYEIHVSTTPGFSPSAGDATTVDSIAGGGAYTLKKDPATGLPLAYGTIYYVKIIAKDVDGAAAASAQNSGAPVQVDGTADIIAASITTDSIAANSITADLLDAEIVLSTIIETATAGQRVDIRPSGITLYAADESVIVQLNCTGVGPAATFNGQINATALNVFGSATIFGATGLLIEPNSHMQLVGGQGDPTVAPVVSLSYPVAFNFNFAVDANAVTGSRISHWSATGGSGGATACYYGTVDTFAAGGGTHRTYAVEWLASNGSINRSLMIDNGVSSSPLGFGACLVGTNVVAMRIAAGTGILVLDNINRSNFALFNTTTTSIVLGSQHLDPTGTHTLALGCDGTNPFIFSWSSATKLPNRGICTMSGGHANGTVTFTDFSSSAVHLFDPGHANNLGDSGGAINVVGAAWDGTNWYVNFSWGNSAGALVGHVLQQYVQATSAIVAKQEVFVPTSKGFMSGGLAYDGTDYYAAGGTATLTNRRIKGTTALTWDYTLGTTWGFGYTWSTSGSPFTAVSPVTSFSMDSGITAAPLQRATVIVTLPTLPGIPNQNLLYAKPGSSTASALLLQSATSHASTNTGQTITFKNYDGAGAVNGNSNVSTYTSGGTPSYVASDGSGVTNPWKMDSQGVLSVSRATAAQIGTLAPAAASIFMGNDTGRGQLAVQGTDGNLHALPYDDWAYGGEGLREALFATANVSRLSNLKAQNFDPFYTPTAGQAMTTQRLMYLAIYWPGGTLTGIKFILQAQGIYTDTDSELWLNSTDGTTLTKIAGAGTTTPGNIWKHAAGQVTFAFTSPYPTTQAAGIYYIGALWAGTSPAPAPSLMSVPSASGLGNAMSLDIPSNSWPIGGFIAGKTTFPGTQLLSGLTVGTAFDVPFFGLY